MTTILEIADKVTAKLNAASLSQTFEAARLYVPNFDLSDLKELRVTVVPREIDLLPLDRTSNKVHAMIDVAVQKKFKKGDAAEIDPLFQFVEEVGDEFRLKRLQFSRKLAASKCKTVCCFRESHGVYQNGVGEVSVALLTHRRLEFAMNGKGLICSTFRQVGFRQRGSPGCCSGCRASSCCDWPIGSSTPSC